MSKPLTAKPLIVGAATVVACVAAVVALAIGSAVPASAGDVVVRPGETLSEIAERNGVSTSALAAANGISDHDHIEAGQRLVLPNGGASATRHTVRAGENLSTIARRYGVTTSALARVNSLSNPNLVRIGSSLVIPAGGSSSGGSSSGLPERLAASSSRMALIDNFDHWAGHYGVPADLLKAMTWLESGWQNTVVSSTGAMGIGQLMPDTVDFVSDVLIGIPLDPTVSDDNIRMSARYLKWLLDRTGGSSAALAGYYQGLTSVQRDGVYAATQTYVADVQALRARF